MNKRFIRFFTIADFEEEEAWLREQHQQGWRLIRVIPPCFYYFESCEPQDMIYRLTFDNAQTDRDYLQMAQDFGWEYCQQSVGFRYFRKPANGKEVMDDEIFTDKESKLDQLSMIVHTRLMPLTFVFLCCIIPNLLNSVRGTLGRISNIFAVIFGCLFVIYVFLIVYCGNKLRILRKRYENH